MKDLVRDFKYLQVPRRDQAVTFTERGFKVITNSKGEIEIWKGKKLMVRTSPLRVKVYVESPALEKFLKEKIQEVEKVASRLLQRVHALRPQVDGFYQIGPKHMINAVGDKTLLVSTNGDSYCMRMYKEWHEKDSEMSFCSCSDEEYEERLKCLSTPISKWVPLDLAKETQKAAEKLVKVSRSIKYFGEWKEDRGYSKQWAHKGVIVEETEDGVTTNLFENGKYIKAELFNSRGWGTQLAAEVFEDLVAFRSALDKVPDEKLDQDILKLIERGGVGNCKLYGSLEISKKDIQFNGTKVASIFKNSIKWGKYFYNPQRTEFLHTVVKQALKDLDIRNRVKVQVREYYDQVIKLGDLGPNQGETVATKVKRTITVVCEEEDRSAVELFRVSNKSVVLNPEITEAVDLEVNRRLALLKRKHVEDALLELRSKHTTGYPHNLKGGCRLVSNGSKATLFVLDNSKIKVESSNTGFVWGHPFGHDPLQYRLTSLINSGYGYSETYEYIRAAATLDYEGIAEEVRKKAEKIPDLTADELKIIDLMEYLLDCKRKIPILLKHDFIMYTEDNKVCITKDWSMIVSYGKEGVEWGTSGSSPSDRKLLVKSLTQIKRGFVRIKETEKK